MNFQTIKVQNFQLALYMLSIRAPEPPFLPIDTFIFPISPQRIRKIFTSMSAVYDTQGTPVQSGVNREIDRYGMSPFTYDIEGTTGWDLHMTDGFAYPGMSAIQRIQQMFFDYDANNAIQRLNNNPNSFTMEFADFFNGEFYQVEPIGPVEIRASDRAPLLQYYRIRLAGIQPIAAPLVELGTDAIGLLFSTTGPAMLSTTLGLTASVLGLY